MVVAKTLRTAAFLVTLLTVVLLAVTIGAQVLVPGRSGNRHDATLNPMPDSVLFSPAMFSVQEIARVPGVDGAPGHHGVGDTDRNGHPEIYVNGWSGFGFVGPGKPVRILIFEARPRRTVMLDAKNHLGRATTQGSAFVRVDDFDQDGRPDVMILGYTESSKLVVPNTLFLNRGDRFQARNVPPKMAMHEGNLGDFDGDGDTDIIASATHLDYRFTDGPPASLSTGPNRRRGAVSLFINNGRGAFKFWPIRFNQPVEGVSNADGGFRTHVPIGGSSASALGNLDDDPAAEIVLVDNIRSPIGNLPDWNTTDTWIVDNIQFEERHAYGESWPLPRPYLEANPNFELTRCICDRGHESHDIHVELLDIDNDGDNDIVIDNWLWTHRGGEGAGVKQFLRNDGNLRFIDVTETVLHNFNVGKATSHDPRYLDVNGDGFVDIVQVQGGDGGFTGEINRSWPGTWANEILINAGNGKFVSAFWEGFHALTLRQEAIFRSYPCDVDIQTCGGGGANTTKFGISLFDNRYYPYLLKDGRLGFVTFQEVHKSPFDRTFWFDVRANRKLYTGPRGEETASKGAPGYSEYFYLTEYPDARRAVQRGAFPDGLTHYKRVGRREGRFAFAPGTHVHGSNRNDRIMLREGDERAFGYRGNDRFWGGGGNDFIDGGAGTDTAVYPGNREGYEITVEGRRVTVTARGNTEGTDRLISVETLQFADQTVAISTLRN